MFFQLFGSSQIKSFIFVSWIPLWLKCAFCLKKALVFTSLIDNICDVRHITNFILMHFVKRSLSYVYWTVRHLDSWIKIDQPMSLALFFAQRVSNASTFIFRSLRLCVCVYTTLVRCVLALRCGESIWHVIE